MRTPSVDTAVSTLSGGNQQKVIVAREFSHARRLLILSQPTRGLDVGSIQYIHRQIVAKRDEGVAVLHQLRPSSTRCWPSPTGSRSCTGGRVVDVLDRAEADRQRCGLLMAGAVEEAAALGAGRRSRTRSVGHVSTSSTPPGPPPSPTRRPARLPSEPGAAGRSRRCGGPAALVVPALALFTALVVGGLVMVFTDPDTLNEWSEFFADPPGRRSRPRGTWCGTSYQALWRQLAGVAAPPSAARWSRPRRWPSPACRWPSRSAPGLFNIGAAGQLIVGAALRRLRRLHVRPARRRSTCPWP